MRNAASAWVIGTLTALLSGCSNDLVCGSGTERRGDACVAIEGGANAGGAGAAGAAGGGSATGGAGGAGGTGGQGPVDPGYPQFPDTVGNLSVAIRTGDGLQDGTDANGLQLCLSATECFTLDVADVDDFRNGEFDVYHFEGLDLPRSAVDRVEIRSTNGTDAWRPACMEIRFDGEPVYCDDSLEALLGNGDGTGESELWTDPEGLHSACVTCYPESLTHGPMVGAVDHESARLLVRTDATRRVVVRLLEEGATDAPIVAYVYPSPADDYMMEVVLEDLAPERGYAALFEVEGELASRSATFRTSPTPGSGGRRTRFAFGSCSRGFVQPIFGLIQEAAPDAFFFIGDNHYANSADRDSLRWYYRTSLEVPERAALLSRTPSLATWDDHDYVGNNTNGSSPGKETALRVFSEYWANPSVGLPETPGTFFRHRMGDIEMFFLDARYHRDEETNAAGSMIGAAQMAWLTDALASSDAAFKLILSGSIFSFTGGETWENFPASRDVLYDFIRDQSIEGVVLLGGDVHRSMLRRILRSGDGAYDLPELVSSPLANPGSTCPDPVPAGVDQIACITDDNYFITIDIDTTAADPTLVARIIDQAGTRRAEMTVLLSELSF